jgi:RHS repeat-associated protein
MSRPARSHRGNSHRGRRRFSSPNHDGRYYRARYYHPGLQRFISEDPIGLAGGDTNLYAYVLNNPTTLVDPSGLEPITVSTGLALGIVCAAGAVAADSVVIAVNGRKTTWQQLAVATGVGCGGGVAVLGAYVVGAAVSVGSWVDAMMYRALLTGSVAVAAERVMWTGQRALIMSDHALTQMYRRGIPWRAVEDTIAKGKSFPYMHEGLQKIGYWDAEARIFVARIGDRIATVMRSSQRYVDSLRRHE